MVSYSKYSPCGRTYGGMIKTFGKTSSFVLFQWESSVVRDTESKEVYKVRASSPAFLKVLLS